MDSFLLFFFFFQAEDGIRDYKVTGVKTCALPIFSGLQSTVRREAQPAGLIAAPEWHWCRFAVLAGIHRAPIELIVVGDAAAVLLSAGSGRLAYARTFRSGSSGQR